MAGNASQFKPLVEKAVKLANQDINAYRLRVTLFAILGYAYIFLIVFSLPIIGSLIYIFGDYQDGLEFLLNISHLLVTSFLILYFYCRQILVNGYTPYGKYIKRKTHPQLFNFIDQLTHKLKIPPFKNIILTTDFNVSLIIVPKFGIFGKWENYLVLGIPLMASLSQSEFRSVLTSEIGQIAGKYSQIHQWILLLRTNLNQVLEEIQNRKKVGSSSFFITPFFTWYILLFDTYSSVLIRRNQHNANLLALKLTGAETCALSLIKTELARGFVDNIFWHNIYAQMEHQTKPPTNTFTQLIRSLSDPVNFQNSYHLLEPYLADQTNDLAPQTSLAQRLNKMGYSSISPTLLNKCIPSKKSAAELLLGQNFSQLISSLDRLWQKKVEDSWQQNDIFIKEALQKVAILSTKATHQKLDIEDKFKLAHLYIELNQIELAIPKLNEIIKDNPNHANAHYFLGQALLKIPDIKGVKHLEQAVMLDESFTIDSLKLLYNFFYSHHEVKKANSYKERLNYFYNELYEDKPLSSIVSNTDKLYPHNIEKTEIKKIQQQIYKFPQIKEAYLVQKKLGDVSSKPFFVLGIVYSARLFNFKFDDPCQKLRLSLKTTLQIPGDWEVVIVDKSRHKIIQQMRRIENSYIC